MTQRKVGEVRGGRPDARFRRGQEQCGGRCLEASHRASLNTRVRESGLGRTFLSGSFACGSPAPSRSDPVEHHAQIVCGHFGDNGSRESNGLCRRGNPWEVSQTPVRVAIAKAAVKGLVARSGSDPFAYVRTVEIERRRRREGWKTRAGKNVSRNGRYSRLSRVRFRE